MKLHLNRMYFSLFFALVALVLGGMSASAQPGAPAVSWSYLPTDGAAYGLGLSEDGSTLVAVIGFGFDPGGQIVSLDPVNGEVLWTVETAEGALAGPIVVDGVVYAGMGSLVGGGAAVYSLDAATGGELWRTDVNDPQLPATPIDAIAYSDRKLFVNRGDAVLLKLDAATGAIDWEIELQKPTRGAPAVSGDMVFVATGFDGGIVLAFDAATGEARWSVEDPANPVTGSVLSGELLYVSFVSGELVAFDPLTGEERWRSYAGELDEAVGIDPYPGLPLVVDGTLYVSSNGFAGAFTMALDAATGAELWKVRTGEFSAEAPALVDDMLLVGSDSGDLLALDPATGAELWRVPIPNKIDVGLNQASPALVAGNQIFVRDERGGIISLGGTS